MTENHDHLLQQAFQGAQTPLDDPAFTGRVVARARRRLVVWAVAAGLAALSVLVVIWQLLALPLLELAMLASQVLTSPLIELGEGWLGLIFLPANTLAALFVVILRLVLMLRRKVVGGSFWYR